MVASSKPFSIEGTQKLPLVKMVSGTQVQMVVAVTEYYQARVIRPHECQGLQGTSWTTKDRLSWEGLGGGRVLARRHRQGLSWRKKGGADVGHSLLCDS